MQSQTPTLTKRLVIQTVILLIGTGLLLFVPAGTLRWPEAWVFLLVMAVTSVAGGVWLAKRDPALLAERMAPPFQRAQKGWDKLFMAAFIPAWFGPFVVIGLDRRFHWSSLPLWVEIAGFILILLGSYLMSRAMAENSYAAPVVKIQSERGHKVIDTGPYAYVRHPLYSGALLLVLGTPLLLGSIVGLLLSLLLIGLLAVRALLEERTLAAELPGYAAYAERVRYRLVPHLW